MPIYFQIYLFVISSLSCSHFSVVKRIKTFRPTLTSDLKHGLGDTSPAPVGSRTFASYFHRLVVLFKLFPRLARPGTVRKQETVHSPRDTWQSTLMLLFIQHELTIEVNLFFSFIKILQLVLSVLCNARAPYSGGCKFGQFFYGIWYLGMETALGEPLRRGS